MKKAVLAIFGILLCSALFFSQSLVEVAKKEKARREQYKGKSVRVVTNADLKQRAREPSLVTASPKPPPGTTIASSSPPEPGAQAPQETQNPESSYQGTQPVGTATAVLPDTLMVENAESALYRPDGKYAEISVMGNLDLELSATNGPGDDIAIYARRSGEAREAQAAPEEEGLPVGLEGDLLPGVPPSYGVLVMGEQGDWEAIGRGAGVKSPERFDLGSIRSIKKIRIVFKYETNPDLALKRYKIAGSQATTMGIDAVEALH
jgi:hypothetical protein